MVEWNAQPTTVLCSLVLRQWEEKMIRRFHGIDRHKKYSTVSVLDRDGKELRFLRSCELEEYLGQLSGEDAVVLEASCGSFYWAGRIEETGAVCFVLDPLRFTNAPPLR